MDVANFISCLISNFALIAYIVCALNNDNTLYKPAIASYGYLSDREYKWICHAIDYWSKFNFAFPIETKEAKSVASVFETYIFPYFGVPKIFQSDNGKEFVNSVIEKLLCSWSTDIKIIQGHPQHPQSQGVIERAHRTLKQKLATCLSLPDSGLSCCHVSFVSFVATSMIHCCMHICTYKNT